VVGESGESYDLAALGVTKEEEEAEEEAPAPVMESATAAPAPVEAAPIGEGNGYSFPAGVRASPLARRLAVEQHVDLSRVEGSGPMGRIVRADVEAFQESAEAAPAPAYTPVVAGPDSEEVPTSRIRSRIGARMVESKTAVPHFYVTVEIDMGSAMALRKELNARREADEKISVNDLIVKAAALTLHEFPNLNSSFNGDTIVRHNHINVGIAVALDEGLINVVSKDADLVPLTAMAKTHRDMVERAREGRVKPDDVEGETFAVSNLGGFDVEHFAAIINPPDAGIMAVGSAKQVPVVTKDGKLGIGWRMKATISADHRVTDGAEAARFMQRVKEILEDPLRLLM
jgi:pyruvate dehydrogenase E2 component (dihydrolipoamide acetyltransferase)